MHTKRQEHQLFLHRIPEVPDAQCAWLLLLYCAGPRVSHVLRNIPPSMSKLFAQFHNEEILQCLTTLLASERLPKQSKEIAQLPFREGGLGLRDAVRLAPAAYWASWADCLSQIDKRMPQVCETLLHELDQGAASSSVSVREVTEAASLLKEEGWTSPEWSKFRDPDFKPPQSDENDDKEPSDWKHGWQYHACIARDTHFAMHSHLPTFSSDLRALRLSQKGPCASRHFTVVPTTAETSFSSSQFHVLLRVRLHLPLHFEDKQCKCGQLLDSRGFHRSACARIGLLKLRGTPAEICAARICREAGARVRENQLLRDLNLNVTANDERRLEVIANGLPLWGGKQVAIDTTVISALTGKGQRRGHQAGQALKEAEAVKRRTYSEFVDAERCHLLVMAFEVAGRWNAETVTFLRALARYRASACPRLLRRSVQRLFFQWWSGMLVCTVQRAYAVNLLGEM